MSHPRRKLALRFSLKAFLLAAALGGPVVAHVYWQYFAPRLWSMGGTVRTGDSEMPRAFVDIVWRDAGSRDQILFVIVRPRGVAIPMQYAGAEQHLPPLANGVSVWGTKVFLDGKEYVPTRFPCFLVVNYGDGSFSEVAFQWEGTRFTDIESVTQLQTWQQDVVPALKRGLKGPEKGL